MSIDHPDWEQRLRNQNYSSVIADAVSCLRALDAARQRADIGWHGLANLYAIITGKRCADEVGLGLATSAVQQLQQQLDAARQEIADALAAYRQLEQQWNAANDAFSKMLDERDDARRLALEQAEQACLLAMTVVDCVKAIRALKEQR